MVADKGDSNAESRGDSRPREVLLPGTAEARGMDRCDSAGFGDFAASYGSAGATSGGKAAKFWVAAERDPVSRGGGSVLRIGEVLATRALCEGAESIYERTASRGISVWH